MRVHTITLLLGLLLSGSIGFGQDVLHVTVLDSASAQPVPYATVLAICGPDTSSVLTDLAGTCQVPWGRSCSRIEISSILYQRTAMAGITGTHVEVRLQPAILSFSYAPIIRSYGAYELVRPEVDLPANVAVISTADLDRQLQTSFAPVLNTEPGIRIDERGLGGSRRISIRGSALRSPFAVRNIKMYVDGIAFTSPDGSSPLEVMEVADVQSLLVLKGAAGSVYGPGNGGVMLFETQRPFTSSVAAGVTAGSYGFLRSQQEASVASNNGYFRLSHTWQENKGYRDEEFNYKNNVLFTGRWSTNSDVNYQVLAMHFRGRWGLPGSISEANMLEDPTQSRAFALANGTRVERERSRTGLQRTQRWGNWKNQSSVYANQTAKINPYGTFSGFNGYKDEGAQGLGGRSVLSYNTQRNDKQLEFTIGLEGQIESGDLTEWTLENSAPGTFKYDLESKSSSWMAFTQAALVSEQFEGTIGFSAAETRYSTTGMSGADSLAVSLDQQFIPGVNLLPRVALHWFRGSLHLHASGSLGSSPPSMFEMVDPETGLFAADIKPEGSMNGEVSIVVNPSWTPVSEPRPFGFTGYYTKLNNAILPADEFLFANKGTITLNGYETWVAHVFNSPSQRSSVGVRSTAAIVEYTFVDYTLEDQSFADKQLPGVAGAVWSNMVDFNHLAGQNMQHAFTLGLTHRWTDKIALNDANTNWTQSFHVVHSQLSYTLRGSAFEPSVVLGVRNLGDELYSDWLQVNAFGGRYFNPAPDRSYYAGFSLKYHLPSR